jgi:hypothetical protein
MNARNKIPRTILWIIVVLAFPFVTIAQNTAYTQFWNEVDLVRALSDKWAAEIDLTGTFSNTPSENNVLKTVIQRSAVGWAHYYPAPRWKVSAFVGYYYNKDVPEIGQYSAPEWRFALQGTYYFHKVTYSLNTDGRFEVRLIKNEEGIYEDVYRYRQKLRFRLPLNSRVLRKGVVYLLVSDEVVLRSVAKETGLKYFDCNLFSAGGGYLFTDDLQLELLYVNVFIPRDDHNEVDNAVSLTLTVNNLISKIGRIFKGKKEEPVPEE